MRNILIAVLAVAFTVIFVTAPAYSAQSVLLEYKYKMGDKLKYDISMDGNTRMETANNKGDAKVDVKMKIEQNVLYVNPNNGNIDIQTRIISGVAKNPDGKGEDLKNIGNTVYMTINKYGELLGATSYDANYDPISISISFPTKPVAVGSTWKNAVKQPIPMNLSYKLKEIKEFKGRKCAVIEQEISVGPEVKNIKAKGTGKIYFDVDKGYIVYNETKNDLTMDQEIENDSPNLGPAKKKVKTIVDLSTRMELE